MSTAGGPARGEEALSPSAPAAGREAAARSVLQAMRVVYRAIQAHSRWVERRCGIGAAQLWALWEVACRPGLRVSDLAAAMAVHRSTASNLLDRLERQGLVRRSRGGPDHRVVRVYPSEAGLALVARAPQPAQGALMHALGQLAPETLEALARGLEALTAALPAADREAGGAPLDQDEG